MARGLSPEGESTSRMFIRIASVSLEKYLPLPITLLLVLHMLEVNNVSMAPHLKRLRVSYTYFIFWDRIIIISLGRQA